MARQALEPDDYPFFDYRRFTFSLGIAASDHVWLSGSTAVRFDPARRAMVVDGNLVAQARVIYDKMSKTLAARGWCLGHVVRMVQYVTPAAVPDLQKLAYFRYSLFPDRPSVSTIVVKRLLREEALIEIEGVAADGAHDEIDYLPAIVADDGTQAWRLAGEALQARRLTWDNVLRTIEFRSPDVINPTPRPAGVEAKATLGVVMPQLSTRAKGVQIEIVTGDRRGNVMFAQAEGDPAAGNVIEQCRQAYAQIGLVLAERNESLDSVVKTTEFVTPEGLSEYRKTADVRRAVFAAPYPAATGVVCDRLTLPGAYISIEATAVLRAA